MAKEQTDMDAQRQEKLKILQSTLDKIEKNYGKGSIMRLGDRPEEELDVISTGSIGLDTALGVGGFPRGRVIEIYGPESSGKTTLAIHAIAECQKTGGSNPRCSFGTHIDRNRRSLPKPRKRSSP